ncbi:asparagine--tRNA ligase [Candidatus Uhrbacteria bacterium]|nr:asparagine--tRNA ligase [Candidatus Uhrbacteria bacterium]
MDSNRIDIRDAPKHVGEEVEIRGWNYNSRSSGKIAFLQLRDGTGRIQAVVVSGAVSGESWQAAKSLNTESSVIVRGVVKGEHRAPSGVELQTTAVEVVALAEEYPIGKKEHGVDFLMDYRHLWIRSARQEAILRIRDEISFGLREFMKQRGFVLTDSPIFTPSACEGTTDLFEVKYFDDKAYLSQSGQLYLEATSAALGKTYCFGPAFRSEKSKTRRHLTEFWMLEAEVAFMDWEENMQVQEDMTVHVLKRVLDNCQDELKALERDTAPLKTAAEGNFPRMHHAEAVRKLRELGSDIGDRDDLGADDETVLTRQFDRPVFIHHYPVEAKAFYMKPDPNEPDRALCADMLAPEGYGEVIGGSQRIDDLKLLEERIREKGLPVEAFEWFLDIRRYGSVPHSGFGIGLERTVAWICGIEHVRETIPFPRTIYRIKP